MNKPNPDSMSMDDAIAYLNELIDRDRVAMETLFWNRTPCNEALAEHPTAQIQSHGGDGYSIGMLGVLNGMFGSGDKGFITLTWEGNSFSIRRCKLMDKGEVPRRHTSRDESS